MGSRRFSTRIKACNSRATLSPAFSKNARLRSVWMDAVEPWTTSSSSDCGAASNMKKCICTSMVHRRRRDTGSHATLTFTITNECIKPWTIVRRRQCTITDDPARHEPGWAVDEVDNPSAGLPTSPTATTAAASSISQTKGKSYLNFDPNCVLTKGSTL